MSTEVGRKAESAAADFLAARGYRIVERNWRTRWCEIDIIAARGSAVYFVEVKYRRTHFQGGGLDYITPKKLAQMQFAAEFWCASNSAARDNYRLAAIELTGPAYTISEWLDDIGI